MGKLKDIILLEVYVWGGGVTEIISIYKYMLYTYKSWIYFLDFPN